MSKANPYNFNKSLLECFRNKQPNPLVQINNNNNTIVNNLNSDLKSEDDNNDLCLPGFDNQSYWFNFFDACKAGEQLTKDCVNLEFTEYVNLTKAKTLLAHEILTQLLLYDELSAIDFVQQWTADDSKIKWLLLSRDSKTNKITAFLMTTLRGTPPFVLINYIFCFEPYRRHGRCTALLNQLSKQCKGKSIRACVEFSNTNSSKMFHQFGARPKKVILDDPDEVTFATRGIIYEKFIK